MVLLLMDAITSAEEEASLEGPDREDGDGMLLQTGVDAWTFTSTAARSKQ
jgi:hypothetical protein